MQSRTATGGQTQRPFLARWLLFTAVLFIASGLLYAIRHTLEQLHTRGVDDQTTHRRPDKPMRADLIGGGPNQKDGDSSAIPAPAPGRLRSD